MPWIDADSLHEHCSLPHPSTEDVKRFEGDLWACPVCHKVWRLLLGTESYPPEWKKALCYWWVPTSHVYILKE